MPKLQNNLGVRFCLLGLILIILSSCGDNTATLIPNTTIPSQPTTTTVPNTIPPTQLVTATAVPNPVDKAVSRLIDRIRQDKPYDNFTSISCISFIPDNAADSTRVRVEVREKHGGACPGDPKVSPIIDRFIVYLNNDTILWVNPISLKELPYSDFLAKRQGK